MATVWGNEDVACYFTTKHSWRGKYKRIFSIGTKGITTYNPSNLEVTNQWAYNDFCRISPSTKASNELIITMKRTGASKKIQSMTFSTEHRADLLTEALILDRLLSLCVCPFYKWSTRSPIQTYPCCHCVRGLALGTIDDWIKRKKTLNVNSLFTGHGAIGITDHLRSHPMVHPWRD